MDQMGRHYANTKSEALQFLARAGATNLPSTSTFPMIASALFALQSQTQKTSSTPVIIDSPVEATTGHSHTQHNVQPEVTTDDAQ